MDIINTTKINITNTINGQNGDFCVIAKCRAGFMTCSEVHESDRKLLKKDPVFVLTMHKPRSLQTVEFRPEEGNHWLSVFARTGKKIHFIDESILK